VSKGEEEEKWEGRGGEREGNAKVELGKDDGVGGWGEGGGRKIGG